MVRHDEGFFTAKDNLRLFWQSDVPDAPKAHIALVHGFGEHVGRYKETIAALVKAGFGVHSFDFRGHGQADGRRGHVDRFADYYGDLELFWSRVKDAAKDQRIFLLTHSMGGLVAVHFLAKQKPAGVAGAIFSAPYLKMALKPPPLKVFSAKLVGKAIPWLPVSTGILLTQLSTDPELQKRTANDPFYGRNTTPRWFTESLLAQAEVATLAPLLTLPALVFCGSGDSIAEPAANRKFFESLGATDKKFKEYPGMLHECLNELGKDEVVADIVRWISAHL
jgi:lysophospholipase